MTNKMKSEQEELILEQQEKQQEWNELVMPITKVSFRLNKPVEDSSYYQNILDRMEMLGEEDAVDAYIDTVGGNLEGCIALCDAFQSTPATVTGILTNKAYSAGAFAALCCDNLEVRPYARMMLHSFSGGFGGKDHEIELDYNFNKSYIRNFLHDCVEGFLTEEEIVEMFNGKDFWFDAQEITRRLRNRQEYFQKLYEEQKDDELGEDYCSEGYEHGVALEYDPAKVILNEARSTNRVFPVTTPEYDPDELAFKSVPDIGKPPAPPAVPATKFIREGIEVINP